MKSQGFIVDKYLSKVARMIQEKGYDCKIVDAPKETIVKTAIEENRVYLTTDKKFF